MSKKLRRIVKKIQFENEWTAEEVAKSIGYSRVHLQREMKKQETSELEKLFEDKFGAMLQNVSNQSKDPMAIIAGLTETNRMLSRAHLLLAIKFSSDESGSASLPVQEGQKDKWDDTEELGTSGKTKPGGKKRRGI